MINLKEIKSVAVVGASNNPEKVGHQIVLNLLARGFIVYPINLKEKEIAGLKVFAHIADIPGKPDLVDIVVPPAIALDVVKEVIKLNIKNVWLQPGTESSEVIELLKTQPEINFVSQSCIMMN